MKAGCAVLFNRKSFFPLGLSLGIHVFLLGFLLILGQGATRASQVIQFDIIPTRQELMAPIDMTKKTGLSGREKGGFANISKKPIPKKIFGVTMDSVTFGELGQGDVVLPVGDTLMKDPDKIPVPLNDLTEMPTLIKEIKAPYPQAALQRRIEGRVILELLIDTQGHVISAKVVLRAGYGFDEAALEAVKGFIFTPARIKGRTVSVRITYTYTFILD